MGATHKDRRGADAVPGCYLSADVGILNSCAVLKLSHCPALPFPIDMIPNLSRWSACALVRLYITSSSSTAPLAHQPESC